MKRRTFDRIVTFLGFGLAILFLVGAALLNWGANFANQSVTDQLSNQNISFPAVAGMPETTKDKLAKWAEMQVTTGEMARDYSDLYIWEHMKASSVAALGKPYTYSEVSSQYMALVRGGSTDEAQIKKLGDLRQTLFMGNTLRGMLLQAFAFWQLGQIAHIAALAFLAGGVIMLLLSIAGLVHLRRTPESAMI